MALTYALYELSRHPDIQQRVIEEVDQFGREKEPQFGDLAQFPLIDAVLKEGMRLHPPVTPLIALVSHPLWQCKMLGTVVISFLSYRISEGC